MTRTASLIGMVLFTSSTSLTLGICGLIELWPGSEAAPKDVAAPPVPPSAPSPMAPSLLLAQRGITSGDRLECVDDESWSIDTSGTYTCHWLATHDPGCLLNACGSADDYGQCLACPRTCGVCSEGLDTNQTLEVALEAILGRPQSLSTVVQSGRPYIDETPALRVASPLLVAAGLSAIAAIILDFAGHATVSPMAAWFAAASGISYALLLFCGIATYVPLHPDLCTISWRRLVPLTPQTSSLGQIVSFSPQGLPDKHVYAVLIHARFIDIFAEQCLMISVGVPLLCLVILTHAAYCRRLVLLISARLRVDRILDQVVHRLTTRSYAETEALASAGGAQAAFLGSGGESGTVDCAICMEEYAKDDEVVLLPCRHLLHKECLVSWARTCARQDERGKVTCPLCKAAVVVDPVADHAACLGVCLHVFQVAGGGRTAMV